MEEEQIELLKYWGVRILIGLCLGVVLAGVYYLGGYSACTAGEGELITEGNIVFGNKCVGVKNMGICTDIQGNMFKIPESNTTSLIEVSAEKK